MEDEPSDAELLVLAKSAVAAADHLVAVLFRRGIKSQDVIVARYCGKAMEQLDAAKDSLDLLPSLT